MPQSHTVDGSLHPKELWQDDDMRMSRQCGRGEHVRCWGWHADETLCSCGCHPRPISQSGDTAGEALERFAQERGLPALLDHLGMHEVADELGRPIPPPPVPV